MWSGYQNVQSDVMCGQMIRMIKVLLYVVRVDQNTLLLRVVRWIRMDQNVQSVVMCGQGGSEYFVVTCGQVDKNGSECTECCYVWSGG